MTEGLESFVVRVLAYKQPAPRVRISGQPRRRLKRPQRAHGGFVVTINGDEICNLPDARNAASALCSALSHYGVEGINRGACLAAIRAAEESGFHEITYHGKGAWNA